MTPFLAVFVALFAVGALLIGGGGVVARLNWRADAPAVPFYGVGSDVSVHPEKYIRQEALSAVRLLNLTGTILAGGGALGFAAEAVHRLISQ